MKKRISSLFICLVMVVTMVPQLGITVSAETKSGLQMGTYSNVDYNSTITLRSDATFDFKVNFGEGFATLKGNWTTEKLDTGEIGVHLSVTSEHTGIVVNKTYSFMSDGGKNEVLYLSDGNAGIIPADTAFKLIATTVKTRIPTDEQIAASQAAVLNAVKDNAVKLGASIEASATSGHTYAGYRGAILDAWAVKEVGMADTLKLMPDEVNDYFQEMISRRAFAALVHASLLVMTGMTESQLSEAVSAKTFLDCDDPKVSICAGLGIINGDTKGNFRPEDTITRQEAATMLSKLGDVVGAKGTGTAASFSDISGQWGQSYIKNISTLQDTYTGNAVMGGTGNQKFSPYGVYSRQQAVVTIVRLVDAAIGTHTGKIAAGKSSDTYLL